VCVYVLPYMHTELDTEFACVCLHLESSKQNYYIISLRAIIKAIFTSLYGYVYTQRVYTWVCKNIHTYTQFSNVCVYLFAFMCTEFKHTRGCVCIYV